MQILPQGLSRKKSSNSSIEKENRNFVNLEVKERFDRFKIIGETIDANEQQYNDYQEALNPGSGQSVVSTPGLL